jgi:uncharacterized membrane protein YcaP (DUF421 family)
MLDDIFKLSFPAWTIVLRTAVVYLVILAGLRLAGKREIGQLTVLDLVVLLLISNAVQNAMLGPDTSLTGGVIAVAVLLLMSVLLSQLRLRSTRLRHLLQGSPTLLVLHGKTVPEHMRREGLDDDTLEAALREHGVQNVSDVEMAVLEIDGSISVVPAGQETKRVRHPTKYIKHQ